VTAYAFLGPERVCLLSGKTRPVGEWIDDLRTTDLEELPVWVGTELWEVEQGSEGSARLVRRVAAWDEGARQAYADFCAARLRALAERAPEVAEYVPDIERRARIPDAPMTGFIAARAAEVAGGPRAYDAERRAQASWLADRLGLQLD
jgi:hypothetical protein